MTTPYNYRPVSFFTFAMASSWVPWFIAAYMSSQEGGEGAAFLFNFLGLFGPCIVTLVFIFTSGNAALKADFKNRLVNLRRFSPLYVIALFAIPPIVVLFSTWISLFFGQSADQFKLIPEMSNALPLIVLGFIMAPIIEELAWRGYGVDSLRAKMGPLPTALIFGVLWSLWHAPLIFIKNTYHYELATMDTPIYLINFFVSVVVLAVIANWLYYKHNRLIIAGMLFHSVVNIMAISLASEQFTKCIITVVYAVIAIAIIAIDKKAFRDGPRNFLKNDL